MHYSCFAYIVSKFYPTHVVTKFCKIEQTSMNSLESRLLCLHETVIGNGWLIMGMIKFVA